MDNQHRKISGYRELNEEEIVLMNQIKAFGPQLQDLCQKIDIHITNQYAQASDDSDFVRLDAAQPHDWLTEGRKDLQKGLMLLTRAIAQPGFF